MTSREAHCIRYRATHLESYFTCLSLSSICLEQPLLHFQTTSHWDQLKNNLNKHPQFQKVNPINSKVQVSQCNLHQRALIIEIGSSKVQKLQFVHIYMNNNNKHPRAPINSYSKYAQKRAITGSRSSHFNKQKHLITGQRSKKAPHAVLLLAEPALEVGLQNLHDGQEPLHLLKKAAQLGLAGPGTGEPRLSLGQSVTQILHSVVGGQGRTGWCVELVPGRGSLLPVTHGHR